MRARTFLRRHRALLADIAGAVSSLRGGDDPEALHALRVAARRLHALHRPLAGRPRHARHVAAARAVLDASGPLRDAEVLLADLAAHGEAAADRRAALKEELDVFVAGPELATLEALVARSDALTRRRLPGRRGLTRRRRRRLHREEDALRGWLDAAEPDLHHLRLAGKRLRYALEQGGRRERAGTAALQEALERVQEVLGDWHDRSVWLEQAAQSSDLAPQLSRWRRERAARARRLPRLLRELRAALDEV